MLKKILIGSGAAVAVAVLCLLLFVYKGRDTMTFFQRMNAEQYFSSPIVGTEENGIVTTPIAVASGTDGYKATEFLGARNQIDYQTGYIHVKVAVTSDKQPVLSAGYSDVSEESAKLSRVFEAFEKTDSEGIVLELSEYTNLTYINAFLVNTGYTGKTVVTGVYQDALEYVASQLPDAVVLCDYGEENTLSLEQIKTLGAEGILCSGDAFDEDIATQAQSLGLVVWVDCGDDIYSTIKAMKFSPNGIVSSIPDFACGLKTNWSVDEVDIYCGIYKSAR